MGIALLAVLTFSAFVASSALAEATFSLAEWLANGASP
jgi:hypothetical protein